jgi:uncharacterized RDD family membrane protein YckC
MTPSNTYAGFWLRFVAYLLDYIVIYIIQAFVFIPILGILGISFAASTGFDFWRLNDEDMIGWIIALVSAVIIGAIIAFIIQVLYFSIMESSKYQATLGKIILGLIVTDTEGNRLDIGKSLLRNLGKIISGFILMIGYIMAGLTDKKQALHDIIAGALVVKK